MDLLVVTAGGQLIAIEVKASAAGIVVHAGPHVFPVSDRIVAAPVSALWS